MDYPNLQLSLVQQLDHAVFEVIDQQQLKYWWIDHPLANALIAQQGAHLISFQPKSDRQDWLWVSDNNIFEAGRPIRGGVPICWPVFNDRKLDNTMPKHGFARNQVWELAKVATTEANITLDFKLPASELLAEGISLDYRIEISDKLELSLTTSNNSEQLFAYGGALHSYFATNTASLRVDGLGEQFVDSLTQAVEQQDSFALAAETDRVYLQTQDTIELDSTLSISNQGHDSVVVWNPGEAAASAMVDVGKGLEKQFICIEAAITQGLKFVLPGQSDRLVQVIQRK